VCLVCPLITQELEGRLLPNFQGSSRASRDGFRHKTLGVVMGCWGVCWERDEVGGILGGENWGRRFGGGLTGRGVG